MKHLTKEEFEKQLAEKIATLKLANPDWDESKLRMEAMELCQEEMNKEMSSESMMERGKKIMAKRDELCKLHPKWNELQLRCGAIKLTQ